MAYSGVNKLACVVVLEDQVEDLAVVDHVAVRQVDLRVNLKL
jgi:hypothetical protein